MPKIKVKGQTVQTGECPQTNGGHTHGSYQTYYLPYYAVDWLISRLAKFMWWLKIWLKSCGWLLYFWLILGLTAGLTS